MKKIQEIDPSQEHNSAGITPTVAESVESVFGCKWSLRILGLIRNGVNRPGVIERSLQGLTPRVLNYYLRRMVSLGILQRVVYPEVPPRVEYQLTEFGQRFMPILDSIEALQRELELEAKSNTNIMHDKIY